VTARKIHTRCKTGDVQIPAQRIFVNQYMLPAMYQAQEPGDYDEDSDSSSEETFRFIKIRFDE
jgi:hypothetical protein